MPAWVPLQEELGVRVLLFVLVNRGHVLSQIDHLLLQNTGLGIVLNIRSLKGTAIFIHQTGGKRGESEGRGGKGSEGRGGKRKGSEGRVRMHGQESWMRNVCN